jgi:MFS family permease
VAGAGVEVFGVGWNTSLHQHIPEAVLSRVSSYDALGSFVAMPIGAMAFGWLATTYDHRSILLVSAIGYAVLSLATLAAPSVRGLRQVGADAGPETAD